jgi:hypothetical protein
MSHDLLNDPSIDWSECTYDGARLKNHRDFAALSFAEKLETIEALNHLALEMLAQRKQRNLPYFDPYTKQLVRPSS